MGGLAGLPGGLLGTQFVVVLPASLFFSTARLIFLSMPACLGFTLLISMFTGLIFGIIPAIKASGTDINEVLKTGGRGGALGWTHNRFAAGLLVISGNCSGSCGAGRLGIVFFLRSMQNAQKFNPGFRVAESSSDEFRPLAPCVYDADHGQQFFPRPPSNAPKLFPES